MIASLDDAIKFLKQESQAYKRRAKNSSFEYLAETYEENAENYQSIVYLLEHYKKIREIVGQWAGDYYDHKAAYFDKILETFVE